MSAVAAEPVLGDIAAPRAQPFYFGAAGAECFAWLHPPAPERARKLAVLLCNPLGYDVMRAHRSYRYLATRLAAEGYPCLRFDYPSTCDSVGSIDDPGRVPAWLASIREAGAALRAATGVEQLVLFGLRSGATLAAAAAPELPGVAAYIGWAPFASGGLLLREFRALANLGARVDGIGVTEREDGGMHVAGFGYSIEAVRDLEALSLTKPARPPAPRCLLLQRDDLPADARLEKAWSEAGATVRGLVVPGYNQMMRDAFESQLPLSAVESIVAEVQSLPAQAWRPPPPPELPTQLRLRTADGAVLAESAVWFGEQQRLSGVLAAPVQGKARRTAVLFPTVGANHRVGANRLHVEISRGLAARGYLCLRMDIDGTGDSGTVCERERFWEYKRDTYKDLLEAIAWLRAEQGVEQVLLWGICSGAFMAYHAALASGEVCGVMLFNIQLFRWHEDEIAQNQARNSAKSIRYYLQEALKRQTWQRLLGGKIQIGTILTGLAARVRKRLKARFALLLSKWLRSVESPAKQVQRLAARGCRVSFICSPEDIGLHEIKGHLGQDAINVIHLPGVEFVTSDGDPGRDHTFTSIKAQRWVRAWSLEQVQRHFP